MVGDLFDAEIRGVADHDAVLGGGLQVDRVDAGGAGDDRAQTRGRGEVVAIEWIEADGAGGGAFERRSACLGVLHVGEIDLTTGLLDNVDVGQESVGVFQGHEDSWQVRHESILSGGRLSERGRWSKGLDSFRTGQQMNPGPAGTEFERRPVGIEKLGDRGFRRSAPGSVEARAVAEDGHGALADGADPERLVAIGVLVELRESRWNPLCHDVLKHKGLTSVSVDVERASQRAAPTAGGGVEHVLGLIGVSRPGGNGEMRKRADLRIDFVEPEALNLAALAMAPGTDFAQRGEACVHVERGGSAGNAVIGAGLVVEELVDVGCRGRAQIPHDRWTGAYMGEERVELLNEVAVDKASAADGTDALQVAVQEERGVARDGAFSNVLVDDGSSAEAALGTRLDGVVDLDRDDALGPGVRADFEARQQ